MKVVRAFTNHDDYKFTGSNYTLTVCSTAIDVKWTNRSTLSFQPVALVTILKDFQKSSDCHFCELERLELSKRCSMFDLIVTIPYINRLPFL